MANTCAFLALCLLSVVVLSHAESEPYILTLPPSICPDGVSVGESYPGPGCSTCKCEDYFSISCVPCPLMRSEGTVEFEDETQAYPQCCPQHLKPENVQLRKKSKQKKQCDDGEQLMCVKIQQ